MEEKLYTIPVMDAFKVDCECPLCKMRDDIENDNISFAMGPSYMEDYIRFETDEKGYCTRHVKKLYEYIRTCSNNGNTFKECKKAGRYAV